MSRSLLSEPLILLLLIGTGWCVLKDSKIEALYDGSVLQMPLTNLASSEPFIKQITIAPSSNTTFNVTNVSSSASFIIVQVHTYQYNVTLSYDKDHLHKVSNRSVFGSNIGLYVKAGSSIVTQLYLRNDNLHLVDAIAVAIIYNDKAPVPGGCNMEFNTEIAPYARLQLQDTMVVFDTQPASIPFNDTVKPFCDKNPVEHSMYQMFITEQDFSPESYFIAISSMLTVDDIVENGRKVSSTTLLSPMRKVFSAYTGTGSVYVAVATYGKLSTAYVPTFSYACSPVLYPESCDVLTDTFPKFICAGCFFLGLLSVCLGHYHLPIDQSLPIFFTSTILGYMITQNIGWALLIGLFGMILWHCFRVCFPILGLGLFNISLGFFFTNVVYFHAPDSFIILQSNWVFWSLFASMVVLISLIMMSLHIVACVVSCAIYSSYMMVLPLDYWVGSSLKYIIINVIRRATVDGYQDAIISPPTQGKDIALICLWVLLAAYRCIKGSVSG
ncbi:PREDICTED: transmembrane 7 superfamily member 3-like isoform X2 [Dufourea novaeangliae]|nr:PREDICTED: transmembrane 7 superfamily member 3-like isoform X2 [Dufourea novaeangliae]